MACSSLVDLEKDCNNNVGGGQTLGVNDDDQVTAETIDGTTQIITAATHTSAFKSLYFKRNQINFVEEEQINLDEGSSFVKCTLTVSFKRREAAKSKALKLLGAGQRDLYFVFKDGNGLWWRFRKMQLATNTGGSGAVKADGSKYDVTFVGEYEQLTNEVQESVAVAFFAAP